MNKEICVFLADGFEEIEALTVVDLLRRAEVQVRTISITGKLTVHGAHGIDVLADELFEQAEYDKIDMIVLPGGMPGTLHLLEHPGLEKVIQKFHEKEQYIAAICAAPSILGDRGYLKGRVATSHPSVIARLTGAISTDKEVVQDGHIITSKGMGTAIVFSLKLIEILVDEEKAKTISNAIVFNEKGR
ncbi:MAG: DJ-1/PfpI family protein [Lachnospiraceae bacterium]|nr:DJ-1/PfpI family protein [Lachnospiraceae bacterium]